MAIRDHGCVDFCQPPEHCDLVHMDYEPTSIIGAHQIIADVYWREHKVVVVKVQRAPEFDGDSADPRWRKHPLTASGAPTQFAYMARWRDGIDRPTLQEVRKLYDQS